MLASVVTGAVLKVMDAAAEFCFKVGPVDRFNVLVEVIQRHGPIPFSFNAATIFSHSSSGRSAMNFLIDSLYASIAAHPPMRIPNARPPKAKIMASPLMRVGLLCSHNSHG